MPATNIVPWPFAPHWADGITETLEWKSAVLTSKTGAEQRYPVRLGPRRQIDIPFVLSGQERAYFDTLMMANLYKPWYCPVPQDQLSIGPVVAGQTDFYFDTSYLEYRVGGKVLLRSLDSFDWDVLEVTSVASDHISVEAPGAARSYVRGATIAPAFKAYISDLVTAVRPIGRAFTGTARFTAVDATVWPTTARDLAEVPFYPDFAFMGFQAPILTQEPNSVETLDYKYEWMMETQDNDSSAPIFTAKTDRAWMSQMYSWFLVGRKERSDFRDFLFRIKGRVHPLWLPSFNDDQTPGWNLINPNNLYLSITGRDRQITYNRDGTWYVTSTALETDAGGVPPERFVSDTVVRVSALSLKRFDQDSIEIVHQSDAAGLATVRLNMRDAPDLRVEAGILPTPFSDTSQHHTDGDVVASNSVSSLNAPITITGT